MKKRYKSSYIFIMLLMVVFLTNCGSDKDKSDLSKDISYEKTPSNETLDALIKDIVNADIFDGEMAMVSGTVVKEAYGLNDVDVYASYMSTATKADEITIIKSNNLKQTKELISQYIETRKKDFESYLPGEVVKFDNAIIISCGDNDGVYIVCISNNKKTALNQMNEKLK